MFKHFCRLVFVGKTNFILCENVLLPAACMAKLIYYINVRMAQLNMYRLTYVIHICVCFNSFSHMPNALQFVVGLLTNRNNNRINPEKKWVNIECGIF